MEQLGPASGRHGDACGELMAGGDVADRRAGVRQRPDGKSILVHRQAAAGHAVVFQHLLCAGVAGILHRRRPGQKRGQQPQQVLKARSHDDLVRTAPDAPVLFEIARQRLPQRKVALRVAVGQQLGRRIQQLLLQPRPRPEGEQPRVHAPGGEVIADGPLFRHSLGLRRRGGRGALGQSQILLYIKAAPLPRLQIALRCQHLIGRVHRVHRDGKLCRQTPLAGHPRPRRDSPRPHLGGEAAVELLIKRHIGCRVQRCRQMDHKKPLLFSQCAKLTP